MTTEPLALPGQDVFLLSESLGQLLSRKNLTISCAESCTGGGIASAITDVAGSSAWFERGFVTYSNVAKQQMLAVPEELLDNHGAVSRQVVEAMAQGALIAAKAGVAVATSGIAGPGGGTADKPVGTVWFAWAWDNKVESRCCVFDGDRIEIRHQAVTLALHQCLSLPLLAD